VSMLDANGLGDGYADRGEARLHYDEAGEGPLVVLLHGFHGFRFSWRFQISSLAGEGCRVVAADMLGYDLSSRPSGVAAYDVDRLAVDV
jgi:epoxide hydrolase 4